jgi:four helix bundle protein
VKLHQFLCDEKRESISSKQFIRSGTAIGALAREAEFGKPMPDFRSKMSIALKEANETGYWLTLLKGTGYLNEKMFQSICDDCIKLIKLLIATVRTTKNNRER